MKPYRGGNELLRGLHELDIMDKHQLIIPVKHHNVIDSLELSSESGRISMSGVTVSAGVSFSPGGPATVTKELIRPVVAFDERAPSPFGRRPVLETLQQLLDLVLGIIGSFDALFAAKANNDRMCLFTYEGLLKL